MQKWIKRVQLCILFFSFYTGHVFAQKILINTTGSSYAYLKDDTCTFDDQTNTVQCAKYGTFQNIKKVKTGESQVGQIIGTVVVDKQSYTIYAMSPAQAITHTQDLLATIAATADVLFNPVEKVDDKTTKPNPYPTVSKNAAAVDALLGSQGLNVDAKLIRYFKNFYFYLEYLIRLEYGARLIAYAHQMGIDAVTMLETKTWQDLVSMLEAKVGGWATLENKIFDDAIVPDWNAIKGLIVASSWQELVTTPFWTSLNTISLMSIVRSSFWQKYVKYTITRSYVQDQNILLSIKEVEETIFKYIPNIEVAYYTPDFISLRNASEMFHISLILTDALRARYVSQCLDWSTIKDARGSYDAQKVYSATLDYKKTPFYSIAAYAQDDQSSVYSAAAQNKVPIDTKLFSQEPLLQEELLILSMIKILHALTNYLYDSSHLDQTMTILANKKSAQPVPSIFLYAPEDYVYLEDLNLLHDSLKETVQQPKAPMAMAIGAGMSKQQAAVSLFNAVMQQQTKVVSQKVKTQNFLGDLFNDTIKTAADFIGKIEGAGEKLWSDIKKTGQDFVDFATNAGKAIWEEAESIGLGTAAVFLSGLDPKDAQQLLDKAKALQQEVADHIDKAKNELEATVNDVQNVADDSLDVLGTAMEGICDVTTVNFDTEICQSLRGAFEKAYKIIINGIAGDLESFIAFEGGIIKLTADGINLIANVAADVATKNYVGLESDLVDGLKQFGSDAAVAILEPLTIQFQYFMKTLADALKFCQYFISIITRLFIDATTAITFAIAGTFGEFANLFGANIDPIEWAKTVDDALTEHERLIGTAITTGLLLATIPLTGGASIPLIVMTVGPQIFAAYGSWQADEEAKKQKDEEATFVGDFGTYVDNNETIYQQEQDAWSAELNEKFMSELGNQERNLGYYENLLADNFELLKKQMAGALGSYWSQLLTPNKNYNSMLPADVGTIYGISTGVYELNPSQGFSLYSSARKSFSQEIAVSPAIIEQEDSTPLKVAETKNWFNQKEIIILDKPATEVEIRVKGVYVLNSFYIGLYFGGQTFDIEAVKKSKTAPIDMGYLAKMAVFKKEDERSLATFGVYEHEGKGWIIQDAQAPKFELGTWYHIKMSLQGTNLQVTVWNETNKESASSLSYVVSAPSPSQQIVGVISSGAAIEYQFVEPVLPIKENSTLRPVGQMCTIPCDFSQFVPIQSEQEREKQAHKNMNYALQPVIGNMTLDAVGKMQVLRGQYIYTTSATKLYIDNKITKDYVVPCIAKQVDVNVEIDQGSIGSYPQETSYLVSLVSEKLFDTNANLLNIKLSTIYDMYVKQFGPLSDSLDQEIKALRTKYMAQGATVQFGTMNLQINKDALQNGFTLYNTSLKDKQGTAIKDQKGQLLSDYFLLTILNAAKTSYENIPGNPGINYSDMMSHDQNSVGILSLVTGNLYTRQNANPIKTYSALWILNNYQKSYETLTNKLPDKVLNAIKEAQITYKAATQTEEGTTDAPVTGPATQKVDPKDISTKTDNKGTAGKSIPPQKPADKSIQQQSDQASGGNYSFGGPS